jgi:hypothetical protein
MEPLTSKMRSSISSIEKGQLQIALSSQTLHSRLSNQGLESKIMTEPPMNDSVRTSNSNPKNTSFKRISLNRSIQPKVIEENDSRSSTIQDVLQSNLDAVQKIVEQPDKDFEPFEEDDEETVSTESDTISSDDE